MRPARTSAPAPGKLTASSSIHAATLCGSTPKRSSAPSAETDRTNVKQKPAGYRRTIQSIEPPRLRQLPRTSHHAAQPTPKAPEAEVRDRHGDGAPPLRPLVAYSAGDADGLGGVREVQAVADEHPQTAYL